jgi:RNA polymerase sigma-70 factor, ECF subfamily
MTSPLEAADRSGQISPVPDFGGFYRASFSAIVNDLVHRGDITSFAEAQDATQDAFLIALRDWERIGRLAYPVAYIAKTAIRLAWRRGMRSTREIPAEGVEEWLATSPADERAGLAAEEDLVARMIACLPERQAVTIRLWMAGVTPEEIGRILNVQASTVRSNLRFAREGLKARLAEQREGC